ncbi:MAG TPA: hypothetical protein VIW68_05170 [Candidatus Sulfotelmatobacter sp.]
MTGSESYLLDAGWLFFAAWSLAIVAVSVIAFGNLATVPSLFGREPHRPLPDPGSPMKTRL